MVNIKIIVVGKLKEKYLTDGCNEYIKRMGLYCKAQIVEIDEARLPEKPSEAQIDAALKAESEKILEKAKGSRIIALCIEGKQLSSTDFTALLTKAAVDGANTVSFIIGSSFGLHDDVKKAAAVRLSMSAMTFPHQLMRVILLEQIYRAYRIINNEPYHK